VVTPHGAYSQVLSVKGVREWIFLADKGAITADGKIVGNDDAAEQTRWVLQLIGNCLGSAGASWANVVQLSTHLVGRRSVKPFLTARDEYFSRVYPNADYPPNTLVIVDGLVREGLLVAVTAVAAIP
jgi:enamine deaminase RidA (YjgF/YER057c/UK114 family)